MSYILDALKKSDQQRQRGATPTLPTAHATVSASRQSFTGYYIALAVVLLCAGIAIGWLHPWQAEEPGHAAAVATQPSITERIPRPAPVATVEMPAQHPPVVSPVPVVSPAPVNLPMQTANPVETAPEQKVTSLDELPAAIQQELPDMKIQLHSYSNKPANSIVSINSRMLKEGDTVAPGLRLEQITADGVILGYKGYRFQRGIR